MKNYGLLLLLFTSYSIRGQVLSVNERFSTPYAKACVPYTIQITELGNLGNVGKTYKYEEGAIETLDTFYTYTQPGQYAVVQLLAEDIDPKFDTLFIEIFDAVTPDYEIFWCDESSFYLSFNQDYYDSFKVFTPTDTFLVASKELIITDSNNPAIFKVEGIISGGFENCGIKNESLSLKAVSEPVAINSFSTTFICDNNFDLNISLIPEIGLLYEVELESLPTNLVMFTGLIDDENFSIPNITIPENSTEFCFRVNSINQCNEARLNGNWNCQAVDDNFRAIKYALCGFQNNDIEFVFDGNPNGTFQINRRLEGEVISSHENVSSGFRFFNVNPARKFNFDLIFTPFCLSAPDTFAVAPPYLDVQKTEKNNYRISITEPKYLHDGDPSSKLYLIGTNGIVTIADNPLTRSVFRLDKENGNEQLLTYSLTFNTSTGEKSIFSNSVQLNFEQIVYVPTAFTPNSDGLNDVIKIFGLPTPSFTWRIYNKWGELTATIVDDAPEWDGKLQNGKTIPGVYTFSLEYKSIENELFQQQGSFVLIK